MRLLEQLVRAGVLMALAISAGCGSSGRNLVATEREPLSEPPQPPLETVARVELPVDSHRASLVGMAAADDWVRIVWVEALDEGARGRWAELDLEADVRWVRSLPFVPSHYGRIAERDVFVVEGRDRTTLCTARHECGAISPMRDGLVVFGMDEVLFDFGVGFIRAWIDDDIRVAPIQGPRLELRHVPENPRAGPCGRRWIVVIDGAARWLDDLGTTLRVVPDEAHLLSTDRQTLAMASGDDVALDVCSGESVLVTPYDRGTRPSGTIAVFRGREGPASLRRAVLDDGQSWFRYDYSGASEVLYECEDFDCAAPRIVDAALDGRGQLWLGLEGDGGIHVELRR